MNQEVRQYEAVWANLEQLTRSKPEENGAKRNLPSRFDRYKFEKNCHNKTNKNVYKFDTK